MRGRKSGVELSQAQRLGHATVSITLDTYSHASPAMQEEEEEEEEALIAGLVFEGGIRP